MLGLIQKNKPVQHRVHDITLRVSRKRIELYIDYQPISSDNIGDFLFTVLRMFFTLLFRILVFIDQNGHEVYEIVTAFLKVVSRIFSH